MSHRNSVTLTGPFRVISAGFISRHGVELPEVIGTVQTDPVDGGIHRVLLHSRVARVVEAFVRAYGGDGMEVTFHGKLFSGEDGAEVYVERMTFHVSTEVSNKAANIIGKSGAFSHRGTGELSRED